MSGERERLIGSWQAAEQRLYPIVMVNPEAYARYLALVRSVADELRAATTPEELTAAFDRSAEVVAAAVERTGVSAEGLDLGLAAGAAFALRYREVVSEVGRASALRRIQEARERGEGWVIVFESGDPAGALHHRLEMHLSDGAGLRSYVEVDAETGGLRYVAEAMPLDPQTGDRVSEAPPLAEPETFTDPGAWERAVADLRRRLEERSA